MLFEIYSREAKLFRNNEIEFANFSKEILHIVLWITNAEIMVLETLLLRSGRIFLNQRNIDPNMAEILKRKLQRRGSSQDKTADFSSKLTSLARLRERGQLFSLDFSIVFEALESKSERIK
ncbi:hypothetical protein CDAR_437131 [Caerostris darwini]|uniref:Uncharacterized protein n=1 Tax=Caerostris darwini TaxID=1538125 RepID=A0AAV4TXV2_9ARAC|nr:hypothetical protein CDAR_437131 [Caerostris darwini]